MKLSVGFCISVLLILQSCASAPKKPPTPPAAREAPSIDYFAVQQQLGMDLGYGKTGFKEKKFDACDLGIGLNELEDPLFDCHRALFTLIQVQLSCRASDQPDAVLTEGDLRPLSERELKWELGKIKGRTRTDAVGQAVIRAISSGSQKRSYLRISTGIDYLVMRAGEATNIVTTPSWCDNR